MLFYFGNSGNWVKKVAKKVMYLFSKIAEIDSSISDITVDDHYDDTALVNDYEINFFQKDIVSFDVKAMYAPGLHIQDTVIHAFKDLADDFFTTSQHICFFFYLKGNTTVESVAGSHRYSNDIGMLKRTFLDDSGGGGVEYIKQDDETHQIIVKMSRAFYLGLLAHDEWIFEDDFYQDVLAAHEGARISETLYMNLKMLNVVQDILASQHIAQNRQKFICIKLRELIFHIHQLTTYGPVTMCKKETIIPDRLLEKIRAYLALHIYAPPTIPQLAIRFGVNEKNLKLDFKKMYGTTIYAYVIRERMEAAKKLLLENYNVNEIAGRLGYRSVSHFIKVFKTYHKCTPKQALKENRAIFSNIQKGTALLLFASTFTYIFHIQLFYSMLFVKR